MNVSPQTALVLRYSGPANLYVRGKMFLSFVELINKVIVISHEITQLFKPSPLMVWFKPYCGNVQTVF